ncbi:MAG: hypothetical protein HC898_08030, partial [Phycisphaerales bacterium]|nr:hypothetical protein [Phycisphaerales bacterium]
MRKAAILFLSIDPESAALILKQMEPKSVEEVTRELASLGEVPPSIRNKIIQEFYDLALAQNWAGEGGLEQAKALLQLSLDPGEADRICRPSGNRFAKPLCVLQRRT